MKLKRQASLKHLLSHLTGDAQFQALGDSDFLRALSVFDRHTAIDNGRLRVFGRMDKQVHRAQVILGSTGFDALCCSKSQSLTASPVTETLNKEYLS